MIVHGLGDRAAAWEGFAALMQPEVAVLALDLPDHGEAPAAQDYRTHFLHRQQPDELARLVREFLGAG